MNSLAIVMLMLSGTQPTEPATSPTAIPTEAPTPVIESEDSPTIVTDRPSFSDGVGIVPEGHFQLETGWTLTYRDDDTGETTRNNGPEIAARLGLIKDRLELRFLTAGYAWSDFDADNGGDSNAEGWNDLAIGAKFRLCDQDGLLPNIAMSATTTIPSGSEEFSTRHWDPTFKFIWNYDLGSGLGLGGNLNLSVPSTRDGDHWEQFQGSVYVTYAPTSDLSFFAEYFMMTEFTEDGGTAPGVDFGVQYLLNKTTAIDFRVGFGLNDTADDFFIGAGIAFLF